MGFERLGHRHVGVEDPTDRGQGEPGRLQLFDLQAAGELGVAVVPVSGAAVDVRRPEQPERLVVPQRPRRDAQPARQSADRQRHGFGRLGVSTAEQCEAGAIVGAATAPAR